MRREGTARERETGGDLGLTSNQIPCGFLGKTTSVMGRVTQPFIMGPERHDEFPIGSIRQNQKECNNPPGKERMHGHHRYRINWGALVPSIV